MTCLQCAGKGVFKVCYHDGSPTDYAICVCADGMRLRNDRNAQRPTGFPLWLAWAAAAGVDASAVVMAEEVLDEHELSIIPREAQTLPQSSIAAAMQTRRLRL